jgi:hypothetical protein
VSRTVAIRCIDLRHVRPEPYDEIVKLPVPADPRTRLREIAAERGVSLARLSRVIGKNAAYVQQYIERGSPKRLPEDDRRHLAIYLDVDERELGARDPWQPPA